MVTLAIFPLVNTTQDAQAHPWAVLVGLALGFAGCGAVALVHRRRRR